jgi:hypothetical protein
MTSQTTTLTVEQAAARIDEIAPEHSRTSCSDDNIQNGHTTAGRAGTSRCTRCTILKGNPAFTVTITVDTTVAATDSAKRDLELISRVY